MSEKFIFFFRGGTSGQEEWVAWTNGLKQKGVFVDGAPLTQDGKIVEENGNRIRDFRFDINKNARGFVIVSAKNIEEAVSLSKNCPVFAKGGNVTIRPVKEHF